MIHRTRLAALERRLLQPRPSDACPGCGQTSAERIPWRVGAIFPTCAVCGCAEIPHGRLEAWRESRAA